MSGLSIAYIHIFCNCTLRQKQQKITDDKDPCAITDRCHLSLLFIYINKIHWRQFPVTHRWNLLLQLFNFSPNLLILIIFPQSIVQIPVLIPLCTINLSIISKCMSLSPFYFIIDFSLFNLKRVCYKKVELSINFCPKTKLSFVHLCSKKLEKESPRFIPSELYIIFD